MNKISFYNYCRNISRYFLHSSVFIGPNLPGTLFCWDFNFLIVIIMFPVVIYNQNCYVIGKAS